MESDKIFSVIFRLSAYTGIYFDPQLNYYSKSKIHAFRLYIKRYYIHFVLLNMITFGTLLITQILINYSKFLASDSVVPASVTVVYGLKTFIISRNEQKILEILKDLKEATEQMTTAKTKSVEFFLKIQKLMIGLYLFINLSKFVQSIVSNIIHHSRKMSLIYDLYIPFDYQPIPIFICLQIWCMYLGMLGLIYSTLTDGIFYVLIIKLTSELEEVGNDLSNLDLKSNYEVLKKLIKRYQKLLEISYKLVSCFSIFNLITIFESSIILCFIIFQSLVDQNKYTKYLILTVKLVVWLFHAFFVCFNCQKLQTANIMISEKLMMRNWYEAKDKNVTQAVQMTIIKSQQPIKLQIIKFNVITMETFTSVRYHHGYISFLN